MELVADALSWLFLVLGGVLLLIGALGIVRLPDVYARMHAAGIIDTLGVSLVMIGLMFQAGFTLITVKLAIVLAFIFFTSPTTTHALAQAVRHGGVEPVLDNKEDVSSNS